MKLWLKSRRGFWALWMTGLETMSAVLQLLTPAVKALAKEADYDFKRRAPGVMLPYQQRWIADKAQGPGRGKIPACGLVVGRGG